MSSQTPFRARPELGSGGLGERNWLPLAVALVLVAVVVVGAFVLSGRPKEPPPATAVNAPADDYASSLQLTGLAMSESSNLAGSKVTYIDGKIANQGKRLVTGAMVQVLFRNGSGEIAQNQTVPLTIVRMREPYVDTAPLSAAPLKPGQQEDFRLIFDTITPDWAGATPEIRVLRVALR